MDLRAQLTPARGLAIVRERMIIPAGLMLFFFASSPNILLFGARGGALSANAETSPLFYIIASLCYLVGAVGIVVRLQARLVPLLKAVPVWLIVVYAFVTIAWSINPGHTLSRSISLLGTTMAAGLVATFSARAQLRVMTYVFSAVVGISLLMVVIAPGLAVGDYYTLPVVRGIFVHKNIFGWAGALYAMTCYGALRARAVPRWVGLSATGLTVFGVASSQSASGILAVVVGFALYAVLHTLRSSGRIRPVVGGLIIGAFILVVATAGVVLPMILESFDRTVTLSGRTTIWAALVPAIEQRFFGGWGYGGALWTADEGRDFLKYVFFAGNAQGGYVEQMVNGGAIGCALLFVPLLWATARMLGRSNQGDRYAETLFVVSAVMLFLGVTAPIFVVANQIFWIFTALIFFYDAGLDSSRQVLMNRNRSSLFETSAKEEVN